MQSAIQTIDNIINSAITESAPHQLEEPVFTQPYTDAALLTQNAQRIPSSGHETLDPSQSTTIVFIDNYSDNKNQTEHYQENRRMKSNIKNFQKWLAGNHLSDVRTKIARQDLKQSKKKSVDTHLQQPVYPI